VKTTGEMIGSNLETNGLEYF